MRKGAQHQALIESLSHDGRGVTRVDGKVVFVDGALPDELAEFVVTRKRRSHCDAKLVKLLEVSPLRIDPPCDVFGICGGCSLQHLNHDEQVLHKQNTLVDNLQRLGKVKPESLLPPLKGPVWNYRRKARLGIRYVEKKGGVLVGFHERGNSYITSLKECLTLDSRFSDLLPGLHELVEGLNCKTQIPQIEIAAGDNDVALVFRHLEALTDNDHQLLITFAQQHHVQVWLQPGGLETIKPLEPVSPQPLFYELPDFTIKLFFSPADFTQVNADINQQLVSRAIELLTPCEKDNVLDLFCGLGNFTLPLATQAGQVVGIEGDTPLVQRGLANAKFNSLTNAQFLQADLFGAQLNIELDFVPNKFLLDPPRSGAIDVMQQLVPRFKPQRIVYVSCNPATLARDSDILVNNLGYRLKTAGLVNMFPHTSHIESIAVFDLS
ncbi:MAG: 23S rRNA (uracil(1939)-C(5))-methyltransferase RlmD [Gammaproteobacteria bacterium]|nr:23S rRNA (uracil(1939)-C(5))-methyltransferase RlmD [Gammaproteobacteria bacterium]